MEDLSVKKILIILGILLCFTRLLFIFYKTYRNIKEWKQLVLPCLLIVQLFLFYFEKVNIQSFFIVILAIELLVIGSVFFIFAREIKNIKLLKLPFIVFSNSICRWLWLNGF